MKISSVIKRATAAATRAQEMLINAATDGAREMIARYPFIVQYDQAMGSTSFDIVVAGRKFMISIDSDDPLHDVENDIEVYELSVDLATQRALGAFASDCRRLQQLHDAWSDLFTGTLAGDPISIAKDGTEKREW